MAVCDSDGVRFEYPEGWTLSREERGHDVTLHIETDGTAFWSLTMLTSRPTAQEAVDAVIAAFEEEYRDVDVYDGPELVVEGPTAICELDFVCLDLVVSAVVQAEMTTEFTALVIYQGESREFEDLRPQFAQIAASLQYAGDVPDA